MPSQGPPEVELPRRFADIARLLVADDVERTLARMVALAVATIEGCDHAGVTLVHRRGIVTPAASDDVPRRVDAIQYRVDQGPCIDAIRSHSVVRADDLAHDGRWGSFGPRVAAETGIASMLVLRLFVDDQTLGALSMHSTRVGAFDEDDVTVGAVFATHAALALAGALRVEQLEEALRSRDVIGQAKGILMERRHVTEEEAYAALLAASQRLSVKLRVVSADLARTGSMPGPGPAAPAPGGGSD